MEKLIKQIKFKNKNIKESYFDLVRYEDILLKNPTDHSQFEDHKIPFYVLLLITEGSGKYSLNFNDYDISKGSIFTLRKDNVHKFYKNEAKGWLFVFTESFISYHLSKAESAKIFLLFNELVSSEKLQLNEPIFNDILSVAGLIEEEYFNIRDTHSSIIIRNLLVAMFAKLLRIKHEKGMFSENIRHLARFLEFQKLVEDNCFKNRKVHFYADQMNVTTKTLNAVSQSIIHKSAKSFITQTLILNTKRVIVNSDKTLSEISYQVGFDEPTNFFKYFNKYSGMSPKQFRDTL